ncbi:DUF349 domain-containing protein [Spirosoma agri]|uniref:DUF349 domain-containing protein n=1 Tax=Spirosoma agri TaxID=1987381 RepID=A0A6M0IF95_9BACT|nr:DUF349 domain-containing protein [Spirosoma agri]NEU66930.1 DUF349 domain-containing protein [Spirosoma agri]
MANQEQEINQQPDTTNQVNGELAVNTPDDTTTQPTAAVEGTETTSEPAAASVTPATDQMSDASGEDGTTTPSSEATTVPEVPSAEAVDAPAAESQDADEATPDAIVGTTDEPVTESAPAAVETSADATQDATTESGDEPATEPVVSDEVTAQYADVPDADDEADTSNQPSTDYSQYSKQDFVSLLESQLAATSTAAVTPGDFKKADQTLKEVKPLFDQMKRAEREAALQAYVTETGAEEGFDYKYDETVLRFDDLYKQIKSQKNTYFQNLDKAKDTNFAAKTDLLTRLRELVETDENNAGDPKVSWNEFKKIQDEWKAAGNMNSPHNATLWATYHALVDRYYSNRNIYFELKELDRKRNTALKTEVIEKVEAMAKASDETPVTRQTIDEANALFEEYKHIGPAPKAEQEVLWGRMKAALDVLYDKRRDQTNEQRKESAQLYEEKSAIYEELVPLTSFASNSINDWNDKTKAVMALQDRWNGIKGPMPREDGKELSKKFWAALKTFFHNKGEFFKQLESKREENLRAKVELCEQVETILASGEESPEITQTVIELQRQWKNIGQVPEKQKNSIFDRFKAACDAFFNKKRSKNQETEREFEANLAQKITLIERIEAAANENADLSELNEFKKEWNAIGFVPKKDMQSTQKRYINAVNALVGSTGKIPAKDKERVMLQNEAEVTRAGGRDREFNRGGSSDRDSGGNKRENDIRRRITAIENDIATYRNNIEFFARSKNADKLRAEIDKKIADAETQLDELRHQLRVAQA